MIDPIDRQTALKAFGLSEKTRKYGGDHSGYDTRMLYEIQDVLENLPTIEPRRKGKWIHGKEITRECLSGGVTYIEYEDFHCSECGYTVKHIRWNANGELIDKYCTFCGADLQETKDDG